MRALVSLPTRLATGFALAFAAMPALAQDTPPAGTDWKALLIETIEANGCSMTEEIAEKVLPPLGFEQGWTAEIVEGMIAHGVAVLDETTWSLTLKTEKCS